MSAGMEKQARYGAEWLRPLVEALGAIAIAAGFAVALARDLRRKGRNFLPIHSSTARYLTLAAELQLAGILSTASAPGRERIGKLAAIAVPGVHGIICGGEMNDETLLRNANLVHGWSNRAMRRTIAGQDDPLVSPRLPPWHRSHTAETGQAGNYRNPFRAFAAGDDDSYQYSEIWREFRGFPLTSVGMHRVRFNFLVLK